MEPGREAAEAPALRPERMDQAGQHLQIWEPHQAKIGKMTPKAEAAFVRRYRGKLICNVVRLDAILDALQRDGVLTAANLDAINIFAVQWEKQHVLMDLLLRKGDKAQQAFYKALVSSNPFLVRELDHPKEQEDVLEFLVPSERKCFQWLIADGIMEERSCVGVNHTFPGKKSGSKQMENMAKKVLSRIVPALTADICLEVEDLEISASLSAEMDLDPEVVEVSPEVLEDGTMFRLRCQHLGRFRCSLTGLELEGVGDMLYELVPWDLDFLASKGLRPAGPLCRFTLLAGHFHRMHLPHCQLLSEGSQHFLSVLHATEESVDFITPRHVTQDHVVIDVPGFSCFGLVTSRSNTSAIAGLVLVFWEKTERSLFVLLLPRNICLIQVIKEWKQRTGAKYVETTPDCELIPNHTYKLSGRPLTCIQPESSKFVNFTDYNNFLPSFQAQVSHDVTSVELQLKTRTTGWLFRSTDTVAWHRVVQWTAQPGVAAAVDKEETLHATLALLHVLQSLGSEDFRLFQYHLKLQPNPIPFSQLENGCRTRTVELMVQHYCTEGAMQVAEEILRKMKLQQLAEQLYG